MSGAARSAIGVEHAAALLAFTEAVMGSDEAVVQRERAALRGVLSAECFVDAAAVIAAFNVVDRVADATGIPVEPELMMMSADVRQELKLERFASSANTPEARS